MSAVTRRGQHRSRILRFACKLVAAPAALVLLVVVALRWLPAPTTAFMLGWRLSHGSPPVHQWVSRSAISRELALAVVAAEDQKFPYHSGFDFEAIEDAVRERSSSGRMRGASTITQQLAKNLFLWPGRSWVRKALEAALTVCIECLWPKRRILEVYLNVAQFGSGVFGAQAAALWAFGKPASSLDASEAALLAAVLPDPETLAADRPSTYVRERRTRILVQMRELGGPSYLDPVGF